MNKSQKIKLSVVDQSPIRKESKPSEALKESVKLAQFTENMGFKRYWVSEHHNSNSFSGTSPEILIGQIAAATKDIRIGSAGVMLSHYSPLKIAEEFKMLDAFYPGRIDLGIGRAPGTDRITNQALNYPKGIINVHNEFPQMVKDLIGFTSNTLDENHQFNQINVLPGIPEETYPEIWLLGSSDYSARLAANLGLPFSFADFFGYTNNVGPNIAKIYRDEFKPSEFLLKPKLNVTLQVICAESEEDARHVSSSRNFNKIVSTMGLKTYGFIKPEDASNWILHQNIQNQVEYFTKGYIDGNPEQVKEKIVESSNNYETYDIGIVSNCYYFSDRKKSYELIANLF